MHYYKRNLGDYAKKAGRLSILQHGAYTLLIDACYDRERFPTLEQAIEWTWAASQDEIEAVHFVLSKFFILGSDGTYTQNRILEELLDYHAKADKNKQIAIDRETIRREKRTNRAPIVNEPSPQEHEPPPNQEPRTSNQEPVTKRESKRASRLPTDFVLPDDWILFCQSERSDLDPQRTFEKFRDYWTSKAGRDGTKLDWLATWRNWVREERGKTVGAKKSFSEQQRDRIAEFTGKSILEISDVIAITSN